MIGHTSRRQFMKTAVVSAAAVAATRVFGRSTESATAGSGDKLRLAVIGCGIQGCGTHVPAALRERLVALVDPDDKCIANALKRAGTLDKDFKASTVRTFSDYRKMFDAMATEIDAVLIATPNHQHALPALMAMKLGKGVYVEKPLCYDITEAHTLSDVAAKQKVATQMGNQGHSGDGYRRLCEYIWAGAIGNVTEVHCWSDRANGGRGERPAEKPVPAGLHWDEWIGPAPLRNYHDDLHPHEWHGWHDFGNGSLGNMGCHVMDGAHWALKLGHPAAIELEEQNGGTAERYPVGTRIRWDFPARGTMPPVKLFWYDGKRAALDASGEQGKTVSNRPPLVLELEKKYNRNFGGNGSIYVGDKGYMYTGTYGEGVRIVPEEEHKKFPVPEVSIPRIKGGHHGDFFRACRGGEPACANFAYAAKFTEVILLGCLAAKAGPGRKLEWDGPNMKVTNIPEINRYLTRSYRAGWQA